jgi:transposase
MLCWISIFGGSLIMMGQHSRSEALFYYFRLEDQVSENHLLRLIDKHISLAFVREKLKESYSDTGRPSIDRKCKSYATPIGMTPTTVLLSVSMTETVEP